MKSNTVMAICVGLMTNILLFGLGSLIVFAIPPLAENAKYLLPALIASSILLTPFVAWRFSPRMRPRVRQ